MDIITLANRYLGKVVSVAISGHQRIEGTLASVHHDCLRVTQCLVLHDTDDQGWYGSIRRSEDDFNSGPRLPETLVHIHCVNSITCLDEELELDDVDDGQRQIIVNGSDTDVEPEPEETSPIDQLWEHRLWSEALLIEIGVELIKLADTSRGGQLLDTVRDCRKQIAKDWGLLVPKIRIRDNINMPYNEYRVLVTECAAATGVVHINKMLAIEVTGATSVPGVETTEPVFDIPAKWIDPDDRQQAEMQGCTVVEPVTIIATHLKEVIEHSLAELLTMEQVSELLNRLEAESPDVVRQVREAPLATVHYVLRRLLEERVTIRHVALILESISQDFRSARSLEALVTSVRTRIGRVICEPYRNSETGGVDVISLDHSLAEQVERQMDSPGKSPLLEQLSTSLRSAALLTAEQRCLAVAANPELRPFLWRLINPHHPPIAVIAYSEIPRGVNVNVMKWIRNSDLDADRRKTSHKTSTGPSLAE